MCEGLTIAQSCRSLVSKLGKYRLWVPQFTSVGESKYRLLVNAVKSNLKGLSGCRMGTGCTKWRRSGLASSPTLVRHLTLNGYRRSLPYLFGEFKMRSKSKPWLSLP